METTDRSENSGQPSGLALAPCSAFLILTDLIEDPNDNGDYRLRADGPELSELWSAVERDTNDLARLREIEDNVRTALGGAPTSNLWGPAGLLAATMRCVDAVQSVEEAIAEACEVMDGLRERADRIGDEQAVRALLGARNTLRAALPNSVSATRR